MMPMRRPRRCAILVAAIHVSACGAAQRADPTFRPAIPQPAFTAGAGPVVHIDEGHNNVVRMGGRFEPLVAALRADGYTVKALRGEFTEASLAGVSVLVIGNALHRSNVRNGSLPNPSALTPAEIDVVHRWVTRGGSLFLLVDHMPFAGAAADLAAVFGIELLNGYVEDPDTWTPIVFSRSAGSLASHPVTDGGGDRDRVESVATFDGAAFRAPGAQPVLTLGLRHVSYHPKRAWEIGPSTPKRPVDGLLQGAALEVGRGRLAVFADATMFSAQLGRSSSRLGMNAPEARDNLQLLRNVLRWLTARAGVRTSRPTPPRRAAARR